MIDTYHIVFKDGKEEPRFPLANKAQVVYVIIDSFVFVPILKLRKNLLPEHHSVPFLEALDPNTIKLCVIDDLSSDSLILQERKKLTPSYHIFVPMVKLINQLLQGFSLELNLLFQLFL
jgi:hypothetical protein